MFVFSSRDAILTAVSTLSKPNGVAEHLGYECVDHECLNSEHLSHEHPSHETKSIILAASPFSASVAVILAIRVPLNHHLRPSLAQSHFGSVLAGLENISIVKARGIEFPLVWS